MPDELSARARDVLRTVIQEHIQTGEPVGSHQLARTGAFDVSSATLRSVLADLEALGMIGKPHTSAGRVPTDLGYRYYVDTLVKLREPAARDRALIRERINREGDLEDLLGDTGKVLHALTQHAVVVLTPRPAAAIIERVEFLRLREDRVLAVLVSRDGEVINKVITVDFPVTSDELLRAGNYLSSLLGQVSLEEAHGKVRHELEQEQAAYDALVRKALTLGEIATDVSHTEKVLLEGTGSLLDDARDADLERMRALFRALGEKQQLLALLERVQRARELQIFIGSESAFSAAGDVSVVAVPYVRDDVVLGTVGVIGPTRMNYQRVIPLVNFTAQALSQGLRARGEG